VKNFM